MGDVNENGDGTRVSPDPSMAIHVLHVDDEPDFANLAGSFLERSNDRFEVTATTSVSEALTTIGSKRVDCIVSDYDMPETNGIEFLETVRERYGDVPFVLFTGRGSEEVASEAISAGVSDYLRKESGTDQFSVLANRIESVVSRTRAERRLEAHLGRMTDAFCALDDEWRFTYANSRAEELLDRDREAILGEDVWDVFPETEGTRLETAYREAMETGEPREFEFRYDPLDTDFEVHTYPSETGLSVYFRDVTDRKRRERELEEVSERLSLAIEGADVGVWDWDLRTDAVTFDEGWPRCSVTRSVRSTTISPRGRSASTPTTWTMSGPSWSPISPARPTRISVTTGCGRNLASGSGSGTAAGSSNGDRTASRCGQVGIQHRRDRPEGSASAIRRTVPSDG